MELFQILELILRIPIIPIGIILIPGNNSTNSHNSNWNYSDSSNYWEILAWPAFPGNSVSGIFGILRILELILRILIIPIGIIPIPGINSQDSINANLNYANSQIFLGNPCLASIPWQFFFWNFWNSL